MMNRVVLVGRLTRDPELRYTQNGVAVCTFRLAVNRPFTNQQGNQEADFINCVVFRRPAENVANYLKKGSLAGVEGRIQTRNFEGQDGNRVYITEVVAENVQFLEPKNARSDRDNQSYERREQAVPGGQQPIQHKKQPQPDGDSDPIDISDDDLPF